MITYLVIIYQSNSAGLPSKRAVYKKTPKSINGINAEVYLITKKYMKIEVCIYIQYTYNIY